MTEDSIPQSETPDDLQDELDELVAGALVQPQAHKNVNGHAGDEAPHADEAQQEASDYWRSQLYTVAEFLQRPPKQWIVQDILGAQDSALVYGESGHGKTHVLLDFAFACATGRTFADRFDVSRKLTVVYATGEGIGGLRDRLQAVSEYYGGVPDNLFVLTDVPQLFVTETPAGVFAFLASWQRMADAGIVPAHVDVLIIDTLHNATQGSNENSAQDAGLTQRSMKLLRDKLGCACVLSHHANKSGLAERGSTALRANMDAVLKCTKSGRDNFTLACDKLKDGKTWQAQAFSLTSMADSVRVFWEGDATQNAGNRRTNADKALEFLQEHEGQKYTAAAIAQEIGLEGAGAKNIYRDLKTLKQAGSVFEEYTGKGNAALWYCTEGS